MTKKSCSIWRVWSPHKKSCSCKNYHSASASSYFWSNTGCWFHKILLPLDSRNWIQHFCISLFLEDAWPWFFDCCRLHLLYSSRGIQWHLLVYFHRLDLILFQCRMQSRIQGSKGSRLLGHSSLFECSLLKLWYLQVLLRWNLYKRHRPAKLLQLSRRQQPLAQF